jgi:hypothetical protein
MADKPITFSAPMVRALLAGTKTQTRRLIQQPPEGCSIHYMLGDEFWLPPEQRTPLRHSWEAWSGPLFEAKPERAMCGRFSVKMRYAPGDRVYVREHWKTSLAYDDLAPSEMGGEETVLYLADGALSEPHPDMPERIVGRHRQAMHMPRWASRMWLEITDVRVQRLQDISEADCVAEGIEHVTTTPSGDFYQNFQNPTCPLMAYGAYRSLWDHINGDGAWDANPWVCCYSFQVHLGNIDQ